MAGGSGPRTSARSPSRDAHPTTQQVIHRGERWVLVTPSSRLQPGRQFVRASRRKFIGAHRTDVRCDLKLGRRPHGGRAKRHYSRESPRYGAGRVKTGSKIIRPRAASVLSAGGWQRGPVGQLGDRPGVAQKLVARSGTFWVAPSTPLGSQAAPPLAASRRRAQVGGHTRHAGLSQNTRPLTDGFSGGYLAVGRLATSLVAMRIGWRSHV